MLAALAAVRIAPLHLETNTADLAASRSLFEMAISVLLSQLLPVVTVQVRFSFVPLAVKLAPMT